jgi:hypothetical protein
MLPNPERRQHPRDLTAELIRFSFPLSFKCVLAELVNIGEGGLCMKTDRRADVGQRLFIRPFAAGGYGFCSRNDTGCAARVRWCQAVRRSNLMAYYIGIEFQTSGSPACRL